MGSPTQRPDEAQGLGEDRGDDPHGDLETPVAAAAWASEFLTTLGADEFMCRCSDEETAKCEAVLAKAREIVSKGSSVESDLDLVDRMLGWLCLDGDVSVGGDQWFVVSVRPFDVKPEVLERYAVKEPVWIQCDRITDGLAAAVVFYYRNEASNG